MLPGHLELTEQWLIEPLRGAGLADFVAGLRAVRDHAAPCSTVGSDGAALPAAPASSAAELSHRRR